MGALQGAILCIDRFGLEKKKSERRNKK